jgi:hypothetical protein
MVSLKSISFYSCKSIKADFDALLKLPHLKSLGFGFFNTKLQINHMKILERITTLRYLDLWCIEFNPGAELELRNVKNITALRLGNGDQGKIYSVLNDIPHLERLSVNDWDLSKERVLEISKLSQLKSLDLSYAWMFDRANGLLRDLKSLESLNLYRTGVPEEELKYINQMNSLRSLTYDGDLTSEKTISYICSRKSLKVLNLEHDVDFEKGEKPTKCAKLNDLGNLMALEQLNLSGREINNSDLAIIASLRNLKRLNLSTARIHDQGLLYFKPLRLLEELNLNDSPIQGQGLANLSNLKCLKVLRLHSLQNNGRKALPYLVQMRSLRYLNVYLMDKNVLRILQSALPHCEIETRNNDD